LVNEDDNFDQNYQTTIFVDFKFRTFTINKKKVKVQIWDTSGQEKFASLSAMYYKNADFVVMVFDMSRPVG
jgi:small GTP-binding protein